MHPQNATYYRDPVGTCLWHVGRPDDGAIFKSVSAGDLAPIHYDYQPQDRNDFRPADLYYIPKGCPYRVA